jgi:hypothetical protein
VASRDQFGDGVRRQADPMLLNLDLLRRADPHVRLPLLMERKLPQTVRD